MPPSFWHGHEMLFGFIGAAIAGFLLTAVPSWTGSRGFAGAPLVVSRSIAVAYLLLLATALAREFGPALVPDYYLGTVEAAALLWIAAFAVYVVVYASVLTQERADGKPG